jgi:hypothetical protein
MRPRGPELGADRVVHEIDQRDFTVIVVPIDHRPTLYRPTDHRPSQCPETDGRKIKRPPPLPPAVRHRTSANAVRCTPTLTRGRPSGVSVGASTWRWAPRTLEARVALVERGPPGADMPKRR